MKPTRMLIVAATVLAALATLRVDAQAIVGYPNALKCNTWEKVDGGKVAEFSENYGVDMCKLMRLAQKQYNAIEWTWLERVMPKSQSDWTEDLLKQGYKNAQKAFIGDVRPLKKTLAVISKKAAELPGKWKEVKKMKKLPKKLKQKNLKRYTEEVSEAADDLLNALNPRDQVKPEFDEAFKRLKRLASIGEKMLGIYKKKLPAAIAKVEKNPTAGAFAQMWKEEIRGMGTAIANVAGLKKKWTKRWNNLSSESFKPKDDKEVEDRLKILKKETKALLSDIGKL